MSAHPAIRAALKGREPTPEQWAAIEHPASPLSVVAGAGSGKTAVMAARIAHLILRGDATPAGVLGLTFTNKAAQELEERVQGALERLGLPASEEVSVFTYHAFADRVIRDYGPKIGIEPEIALMTTAQARMLIGRLLEDLTFEHVRVNWVPSVVAKVTALADACANHLVAPETVAAADRELLASYEGGRGKVAARLRETLEQRPEICRAVRAYIDRKRELGRIDYGDQIRFACRLVSERPEVARALRARWPVVLLDEYQDTNVAQRVMLGNIYPPGSAITVVGDPDQAIYAWRGATLYNIVWFPDHFPGADGKPAETKPLQVSFRSGRRILRAADALIARIPTERRGTTKILAHDPRTGEGDVTCDLVASEAEEADLVAAEIASLALEGGAGLEGDLVPLDEIAILCRSRRRLFPALQQALRKHDVPVEVVGLGGLLSVPEVVDLLAHLRLAVRPGDNIAFARVAMGPKWRIGTHDLAALARWAAVHTRAFQERLEERADHPGEVDPGEERFSLSEALGSLDDIPDLSPEARGRLARLHRHNADVRAALQGCTLPEAVERVLAVSGLEDELALAANPAANAARANLSSFLDHANSFAPLEGEASVPAFLDYLDSALEVEELEMAQPQLPNSVKLMTMHQAKGLEFDVVFLPGMAKGIFPDARVMENPTRSVSELPYSVREDARFLPRFEGNMEGFHAALKERVMDDERRLAYVALTRARRALRLSAAHWYGRERKTSSGPGDFLVELAGTPGEDGAGTPGDPAVRVRSWAERPEANPIRSDLEERARAWPRAAGDEADALFPDGWRAAAERALEEPGAVDEMAAAASVDPAALARAKDEVREQLRLTVTTDAPAGADERLRSMSVSSIVQFARCPKQFYWTVVRPLPRRASAAARLGTEIHRWIESRSVGQQRLDDPEEAPDLTPEELRDDAATTREGADWSPETLKRTWETSRFARMRPRVVEQAFVLALDGGYLVRGRIDAVFVDDEGRWELVDYKTGAPPEGSDPVAQLQLTVYALAARRIWSVDPSRLSVSYFYLRSGDVVTTPGTRLAVTESDLLDTFRRLEHEDFEPTPSDLCRSCDFLRFCAAGRNHVAASSAPSASP